MLGFYDSGLGGVTILKEFLRRHPKKNFLYYADTAHCPLGDKTGEEIFQLTVQGVEFLFNQGCELVVLACNTATSVAIRRIQQEWLPAKSEYQGKNVLGVVRPVAEVLQEINGQKKLESVLILATKATCDTQFYQEEFKDSGILDYKCVACPGLAEAVENLDDQKVGSLVQKYLLSEQDYLQKTDSVVLACTHYPIYQELISDSVKRMNGGRSFKIFSQSELVCDKLDFYLQSHPKYALNDGKVRFYASSKAQEFQQKIKKVFGLNYSVEKV